MGLKSRKQDSTFRIVGIFGCPIPAARRRRINRESLGVLGAYDDHPGRGNRTYIFRRAADLTRWSTNCGFRRVCVLTAASVDALPDGAWEQAKRDALIVLDSARKRGETEYLRQAQSLIRASNGPRGKPPSIGRRRERVEVFRIWLRKNEGGNLKEKCADPVAGYEKQIRAMSARCLELLRAVYTLWDDSGRPQINKALLKSPSAFDRSLVGKFGAMGFVFPSDLDTINRAIQLALLKHSS